MDQSMLYDIFSVCPCCTHVEDGPFPHVCPECGFNVDVLGDQGTTDHQMRKWTQHSDIIQGREVQFYDKEWNASFDLRGYANLTNVLRFTLTYGDGVLIPSRSGRYLNRGLLAHIPEIIGSGTHLHDAGTLSCSGVCIISPGSTDWGHSFPVLDGWVAEHFGDLVSFCRSCGCVTTVGQPICGQCYQRSSGSWLDFL